MSDFFDAKSASYIQRERERARRLRETRWWREKRDKGVCHHCGKSFPPSTLTMDHIVPLARGGRTGKNNVVPSCKSCNTQKSHRPLMGMSRS